MTKIEVVEIETGKVVHELLTQRDPDRVMAGMLINMDTDKFFVREGICND